MTIKAEDGAFLGSRWAWWWAEVRRQAVVLLVVGHWNWVGASLDLRSSGVGERFEDGNRQNACPW